MLKIKINQSITLVAVRSPSVLVDEEDRPEVGSWNYTDGKVYCILSVFAMRMTFESDQFVSNSFELNFKTRVIHTWF